jgi:hypothetical protein
MLFQLLFATASVALASSSQSSPNITFLPGAKLSNATQIFLPIDPNVEQRWDIFSPPSYSLAIVKNIERVSHVMMIM